MHVARVGMEPNYLASTNRTRRGFGEWMRLIFSVDSVRSRPADKLKDRRYTSELTMIAAILPSRQCETRLCILFFSYN